MDKIPQVELLFETKSVLGKQIRTSRRYWHFIISFKHPELKNNLADVLLAIKQSDFVYQDKGNPEIYLYYRKHNKHWVCAVCRHLNSDGFLVTAYLTSKPKQKGKKVWPNKE